MSLFQHFLNSRSIDSHDGRPLWRYSLTDSEFNRLRNSFRFIDSYQINPLDAVLYYAEWWKRFYDGGSPSKDSIFNTLEGNVRVYFDSQDFYNAAVKGGQILGVKWIVKQYTLKFKTLLLQGGLPLTHIKNNHGNYKEFLLAVLEEQPDSMEDFIYKPYITNHLPESSRNDLVYENCFEIVTSFLKKESNYDDLFSDNDLKDISDELKIKVGKLKPKIRLSRPKNYWLLHKSNDKNIIKLSIGLAPKYDKKALENILGFDIDSREIKLFIDHKLICIFKEMYSKEFKTEWFNQNLIIWDGSDGILETYIIIDNEKRELSGFIPNMPSMDTPTLWTQFESNTWRLIKGTGSIDKISHILMPLDWSTDKEEETIPIFKKSMKWVAFEGEVIVRKNYEKRKFLSNVNSFDWVIQTHKPDWMINTNMPVINNKLKIHIFNHKDEHVQSNQYSIYAKAHQRDDHWHEIKAGDISIDGCVDLKIVVKDLVAYDQIYNIGNISVATTTASIDNARIEVFNLGRKYIKLDESDTLSITNNENSFNLKVDTSSYKVPTSIKSSLGIQGQKKLHFKLASPFKGLTLLDQEGNILNEQRLTLNDLHGIRILTIPGLPATITFYNKLNKEVKITKNITNSLQPLIIYREEIVKLFYLSDAMDYKNRVCIELKSDNNIKIYQITGFSHTSLINDEILELNQIRLYKSSDKLELYAVPLIGNNLTPIPLLKDNDIYTIPNNHECKQWIVISHKDKGKQLMPRFVNIDKNYEYQDRDERINDYAKQLEEENFNSKIWQNMLELFSICSRNSFDIPFSTFDQFRTLTLSPKIAAKAFLFLAVNQLDQESFLQKDIPEMEKDLGICFHWISKNDWNNAFNTIFDFYNVQQNNLSEFIKIMSNYFIENTLPEFSSYILGYQLPKSNISHADINAMRSRLGERVMEEIPYNTPRLNDNYGLPVDRYENVSLLLKAPIAVGESIKGLDVHYPIWGNKDIQKQIRRNIQYTQYLVPNFYKQTILHVLTH